METRVSIDEAGSNALVAAIGFYTKLLDRARQTEAGIRMALVSENRRAAEASLELSIAREKLDQRPVFADEQTFLDWYLRLADHLAFIKRLAPVLEALETYIEPLKMVGHPDDYEAGTEARNIAVLLRAVMAARANGGLVPPPAPPHPDAIRAKANGSPERDA